MKRVILVGLALVAILAISVSLAAAQGADDGAVPPGGYGPNYVDADGDGVCDNCGSGYYGRMNGNGGANFVDADGDGVCDNCGSGYYGRMNGNRGANFVDADGDGVCDNCGTGSYGGGANFVDEDGDGICDYFGSGASGPRGQGRGRMANRNASAQS